MKKMFALLAVLIMSLPTVVYGVGIDVNTNLMLHMDGIVGSTSFDDSSSSDYTVTPIGDTHIEIDSSKFGGASGFFDGSGDYLSIPDSSDWDFGSGDFTIDLQVRFNELQSQDNGIQTLVGRGTHGGSAYWALFFGDGTFGADGIGFISKHASLDLQVIDFFQGSQSGWSIDTWYHVALVREGNDFSIYRDGLEVASLTTEVAIPDRPGSLTIGANVNMRMFNGYLDEVRISKGIARWATEFTPPTEAYSTAEPIPEPATIALLGIGLAGLAGAAARRRLNHKIRNLS